MSKTLPCKDCISLPICKSLINLSKDFISFEDIRILEIRCSLIIEYLTFIHYSTPNIERFNNEIKVLVDFYLNRDEGEK